jgi:hypothetical protein
MTTSKPYHGPNQTVAFGRPTIGPRVYLVEGTSGWAETFQRKLADKAVIDFLAPLDVEDVLETFSGEVRLGDRSESWGDVLDFLGKITGQKPSSIPDIVGVGFWAQLVLREQQQGTN